MVKLPVRKNIRLKWYDYWSMGWYFVTICSKNKEHYFGEIFNEQMKLNELWKYCQDEIINIEKNRKTVYIHEFVVMPNHIHILLIIDEWMKMDNDGYRVDMENYKNKYLCRDSLSGCPNDNDTVSNDNDMIFTVPPRAEPYNVVKHKNYQWPELWQIINVFKWNVTKFAKQNNIVFEWQSRFHDVIIRDQQAYDQIKYYIQTNEENRKKDCYL